MVAFFAPNLATEHTHLPEPQVRGDHGEKTLKVSVLSVLSVVEDF